MLVEAWGAAPEGTQSVIRHAALGDGDMGAGSRHAAVLAQAEKIKKAFGVASQRAALEASSPAPMPPAEVSTSQPEAMTDLLQHILKL